MGDVNDGFDDLMGLDESDSESVQSTVESVEPLMRIIIDEVEGQPNFETVGVNGVVYKIQRGVEVPVPRSVVEVLRNAVATKYTRVKRPDGLEDLQRRNLSSIPWRLVG